VEQRNNSNSETHNETHNVYTTECKEHNVAIVYTGIPLLAAELTDTVRLETELEAGGRFRRRGGPSFSAMYCVVN
jgi:hypothetical protein